MAAFTSDVLSSQKSKDPNAVNKMNKELQDAQNAMRRMQGGGEATVNPFNTAPQQTWNAGEQQRRVAAAGSANQVAGQIDERIAGAKNQLNSVYDKYNSSNANMAQQQAQNKVSTDFDTMSGLAGIKQQKDKLDFTMYTNQAQRDDALQSAWTQGLADDKMMDAAISHNMKLQDVDKYFALLMNDLDQDLADWQEQAAYDNEAAKRKIEAKASNLGGILSGLLGIGGTVLGTAIGGPIGGTVLGTIGSGLGKGIGGLSQ